MPKNIKVICISLLSAILIIIILTAPGGRQKVKREKGIKIELPDFDRIGDYPLFKAIDIRRSIRDFSSTPLELKEVSQLLWAAQGITQAWHRTVPSAGGLYPVEVYLSATKVTGLESGLYHYLPKEHCLVLVLKGDKSNELARAALDQEAVKLAPAVIILTAIYERTSRKYGRRANRYADIEIGASTQNIYLTAQALELGTVMIGAFSGRAVRKILRADAAVTPLGLMPVGHSIGDK